MKPSLRSIASGRLWLSSRIFNSEKNDYILKEPGYLFTILLYLLNQFRLFTEAYVPPYELKI